MYIPISYFGGSSCIYLGGANIGSGISTFTYQDCNEVSQSGFVLPYNYNVFPVNTNFNYSFNGTHIIDTNLSAPIQNLPSLTEYYQITTYKASTNLESNSLLGIAYVPWNSGSLTADGFTQWYRNPTYKGLNGKTYITSRPQFTSVYASNYTIFPLEDSSLISTSIDYLIVAGGGGGGDETGTGGGGAGGLLSGSLIVSSSNKSFVYVGNGGSVGSNGENSTIFDLISIGGGGGNLLAGGSGSDGGSGGGAGSTDSGSGILGQGNDGGSGNNREAGGGGGASQKGINGINSVTAGNGGSGSQWLDGSWYAGGGGGGTDASNLSVSRGFGGIGGGGDGGQYTYYSSSAGQPNTGGGGGGGGLTLTAGGSEGGSGIIKLRYQGPRRAIGGDYTYFDNGYTYHVYTTSGVSSSFEFMGGDYVDKDYTSLPTSSLVITESLVTLIDTQYTESFKNFDNKIIYDSTPNGNNLFVQNSNVWNYVTASGDNNIELISGSNLGISILGNTTLNNITNMTLVSVYKPTGVYLSQLPSNGGDVGLMLDDGTRYGNSSINTSEFGILVDGSPNQAGGSKVRTPRPGGFDTTFLNYSSSINDYHITQVSFDFTTGNIIYANDLITGSFTHTVSEILRSVSLETSRDGGNGGLFQTGSKFKMFAIYTSSLSADEMVQNYHFISQSLF